MSIRLMHLADLHLGAPLSYLGDKAAQRSRELESALTRALERARERNVHGVLIAGDLFDSFNPPPDLVARVKAEFAKVAGAGIPIILIPGTHDSNRYSRSVYRHVEFPDVDVLAEPGKPVTKSLNGRDVHFYGFSGGRKKDPSGKAFSRGPDEGVHVALVHGPVLEAEHWASSPRDFSITVDELRSCGFDYVALGHHHNFREFRFGKTAGVYPGTLEGLKFEEEGDRYLVIAEIDDGVAIEKSKHNQRALSEIQIDIAMSAIGSGEGLVSAIEKRGDPGAIVRVCVVGPTDFLLSARELEPRLAKHFFHLEITDDTSVVGGGLIQSVMNEETVRGMFVRKMMERIENRPEEERATAELALRLGVEQFMRVKDENNQDFA